jgi:phosphinothricin acetyltransferase
MTDIVIRPATVDDAAEIAAIYNHAVLHTTATFDLEPETPRERRRWLASESTLVALVARLDERILGWASLVRWSTRPAYDHTAEASIYVAPGAQRTGVGLALAGAIIAAAPTAELHVAIAQICAENAAGLALAERLGFTQVGVLREVGFKFGRWLDVVVCQRLV